MPTATKKPPAWPAEVTHAQLPNPTDSDLGWLSFRFGGELGSEFANPETHLSARLEFDHGPLRNRYLDSRRARIAPGPRLAHPDFEYPKVAQFHFLPIGQGLYYVIKRPLDDVEHMLLYLSGLFADAKTKPRFVSVIGYEVRC